MKSHYLFTNNISINHVKTIPSYVGSIESSDIAHDDTFSPVFRMILRKRDGGGGIGITI